MVVEGSEMEGSEAIVFLLVNPAQSRQMREKMAECSYVASGEGGRGRGGGEGGREGGREGGGEYKTELPSLHRNFTAKIGTSPIKGTCIYEVRVCLYRRAACWRQLKPLLLATVMSAPPSSRRDTISSLFLEMVS